MSIKCVGVFTGLTTLMMATRNGVFGINEPCILRETQTTQIRVRKQEFGVCSMLIVTEEGYPDPEGINFYSKQKKVHKQIFVRPVRVERRDVDNVAKPLFSNF